MKKILIICLLVVFALPVHAEELKQKLSGRILLQVEDSGQAWYVNPTNNQRVFLGRPADAFRIMSELGLGISDSDYNLFKRNVPKKLTGKILLRVEASGEAYYVNPIDLKLNFLGRPSDAFRLMRELGLGVKNDDLNKIVANEKYKESKKLSVSDDLYLVEKVVDGDTIDVLIDGETKRIRVIGADTPEVVDPRQGVDCFGPEASDYAKKILTNKYVRLEIDGTQDVTDKYGRLLRHVFTSTGENFGEMMISGGFAKEYTYKVASKYQKDFTMAETKAKSEKVGMWASGACDNFVKSADRVEKTSASSSLEIANIFYNGNVGTLEPDEYVEIKNNGSVINLQGHSLNDEGGKKFVFPNFSLAYNSSVKIFTGCGVNSNNELFWCNANSAIWNNTGDKAELKDASGKVLATLNY